MNDSIPESTDCNPVPQESTGTPRRGIQNPRLQEKLFNVRTDADDDDYDILLVLFYEERIKKKNIFVAFDIDAD